jgi:hypothetical protein
MARKYKKGKLIKSLAQYESASKVLTFFMVQGKTTHKAWIESWQYRVLQNMINRGIIYEALPVDFDTEVNNETTD